MMKTLLIFLFSLPLLCLGQETTSNDSPITFEGIRSGDQIEIHWVTASETNNDHYDLWVSTDAKGWIKLYTISNKKTTNKMFDYWYNTKSPFNLYYKLTQVDYDKTIKDIGLIMIEGEEQREDLNEYKLYDLQGRETTIEPNGLKVQYHNGKFNKKIFKH